MKTEYFEFISENTRLSAVLWLPDDEVTLVTQITHGMTEHIGRYEAYAEFMTACGGAVCGFDLRGHGKSGSGEVASFGEGGWQLCLKDMRNFFEQMKARFPDTTYVMMGFSLGSFLLREYLGLYPDGVDGAVIVGTGYQPAWVLSLMKAIVKAECKKVGFDHTSPLIRKLSFETYNQQFRPCQTDFDWLCSDERERSAYMEDPLCRKQISAGLFWQLLDSMGRTGKRNAAAAWAKGTSVLLLSGACDPVGNSGKGVRKVMKRLQKVGFRGAKMKLIPHARHDVLHETSVPQYDQVRECLREFNANCVLLSLI